MPQMKTLDDEQNSNINIHQKEPEKITHVLQKEREKEFIREKQTRIRVSFHSN